MSGKGLEKGGQLVFVAVEGRVLVVQALQIARDFLVVANRVLLRVTSARGHLDGLNASEWACRAGRERGQHADDRGLFGAMGLRTRRGTRSVRVHMQR